MAATPKKREGRKKRSAESTTEVAERERVEHIGLGRRLEGVVSALANHGIPAKSVAGVLLRLDVAEELVKKLEDLQRLEERGYV